MKLNNEKMAIIYVDIHFLSQHTTTVKFKVKIIVTKLTLIKCAFVITK